MAAPAKGYNLPLWNCTHAYRATALAYMQREKVNSVTNLNGKTYTIEEINEAIIN